MFCIEYSVTILAGTSILQTAQGLSVHNSSIEALYT